MSAKAYATGVGFGVSTTTLIRDWAGRIESLLSSGGWVQTSDTGQTAAASLPAATVASQVCGYQIWRMADSLQATSPVFVKFEFGSGGGATNPCLWITVGTGSDGAGNLTGVYLGRTPSYNAYNATSAAIFVGSADVNRLVFGLFVLGGLHLLLNLERNKEATGSDSADGIFCLYDSSSNQATALVLNRLARASGNTPTDSTRWGTLTPSGSMWALGDKVGVCPVRYSDGMPTHPGLGLLAYKSNDLPALNKVGVAVMGLSLDYFTLGNPFIYGTAAGGDTTDTLMLRYE